MRVIDGFVDGSPQATLSAVLWTGNQRELVVVGVDVRVDGSDVLYRVVDAAAGIGFQRLVERDLVVADTKTGLALIQTGANRA